MKEFTPPGLHLLGSASNGFSFSIMLKSMNISIYNTHKSLKPIPMAPECPKMPVSPLFAPNLVKNSSSYHLPKFDCYSLYKLPKTQHLTHNFAPDCAKGVPFCQKSDANCGCLNSVSKALSLKNFGTWGPRA